MSGVPGLGHALHQNPHILHTDWRYGRGKSKVSRGHHSVSRGNPPQLALWGKQQTYDNNQQVVHGNQPMLKRNEEVYTRNEEVPSTSSSSSSLTVTHCHNCGYSGRDDLLGSLSGEDSTYGGQSHHSTTSLDSIDYMLDNCLKITPQQQQVWC